MLQSGDCQDFTRAEEVILLGLCLFTDWYQAYSGKMRGKYGDVPVDYIGCEQLIANKRAVGRKRDLADLEALGEG